MIDLSFLTEEEQEAIMKVLQRDAELKRAEEERVRHLPEKVKDDVQLKNMSGQWFYEAKSKRHRDKIHGADIIRASMRRKPATLAEVSQNKPNKAKSSWVSNVNKEVFVSPELHGIVEHQEEEQLKSTSSSKTITSLLDKPEERSMKASVSPAKQRRNPFNSTAPGDNLNSSESENRQATLPQLSKKEIPSHLEESQPKPNLQTDETEKHKNPSVEPTDEPQKGLAKRPVPKARKFIHKATDPVSEREDFVPKPAKRTERINGTATPPRGILKRSSSSSSTDSEVRVSQMLDVQKKNALPTATIFEGEAEKSSLMEDVEDSTQISLEKLKQVRFSSSTGKGEPLRSPQPRNDGEEGQFDSLKSDKIKSCENDAIRSDSFGNKEISAVKALGTDSSALQVKTPDGLQDDTLASGPSDTSRSDFLVNVASQAKRGTSKKLETPQKISSNILPNNNNKPCADETRKNKANQFLSHESKSHENVTDEHQLSPKTEAREVSNTNSTSLQQGKPDLVEQQDAKTSFKPEKYADELMKVADESVSKVLDWFKRSSGTEDRKSVSARSHSREPSKEVDFSIRTEIVPTECSGLKTDGKPEGKEELLFGKMKQQKSSSSTSLISKDKQLIKERTKPEEENEAQNNNSLTEFDCLRAGKKECGQEIEKQNEKSNPLERQEQKLLVQKYQSEKAMQVKRRIREIRAFWERDKTISSHGEKDVSVNTNTSGGSALKGLRESDKIKPTAIYLPHGLDDQSKNTLRSAELTCAGQASRTEHQNSSEFGPGRAVAKPEGTLPSDGEDDEYTQFPKAHNLQPSVGATSVFPESKDKDEKETLKGQVAACSQQKPSFQILSLKEKMNEKSKNKISSPSQFQSLRNFWDTGVKLQSNIDMGDVSLPHNTGSITCERKSKEDKKGGDNVSKQELIQQQTQTLEREKNQKLDSVVCDLPLGSPTLKGLDMVHTKYTDCVQLDRKAGISKLQEKMGFPEQDVKECVEKGMVSSKEHTISLQLFQLPDDKDALKETAADDCLCLPKEKVENKIPLLDIDLPKEKVAETVDKVVLPKAELDVFELGLKKLEKEASELSSTLNLKENILKETTLHSNQCKVSERRVEPNHDISPADQTEEISKSIGKVSGPSAAEHENKKSLRRLFREFKPFCLQYQAADKDDTLGGSQWPQAGLQNLHGETCASQPSEYRKMGMKTSDDINRVSQTNGTAESTHREYTGQPAEVKETTENSVAPSKVSALSSALEKLMKEASETPPPKPKHAISTAQRTAEMEFESPTYGHDGELPQEIRETIEKSFAPSKVNSLSSALEKLLKETSEMPPPKPRCVDNTVQRTAETEFESTTYGHDGDLLQEIGETIEKSVAPSKISSLNSALEKLMKEASEIPSPVSTVQRAAEMEVKSTTCGHDGELPQEIDEIIEKSVAPSKVSGLSSALEKLMTEASETPPPRPKHAISTAQRTAEVEVESMTCEDDEELPQEIREAIEKSFAPSKVSSLISALEKLMTGTSELPPSKPGSGDSTVQRTAETEFESTTYGHDGDLLWEIRETIEKSVAPSKVSSLNSALEKLMEASEIPSPVSTVQRAAEMEVKSTTWGRDEELPQEIDEIIEKSVAPSKVSGLSSALEKLMMEASETPPPKPKRAISTAQRTAEVEVESMTCEDDGELPQEIREAIEKSFAPSKVSSLSSSLEKLMTGTSELPPPKPRRGDSTVQRTAEMEFESTTYGHDGDLLQEIRETIEKSVAPSKVSSLNSALEKLMKEASEIPSPVSTVQRAAEIEVKSTICGCDGELPQEIDEIIEKSVAPSKVSGLSSALEKLMMEVSETPPPKPKCAISTVQRTAEVEVESMTCEDDEELPQEIREAIEKSFAPSKVSSLSSALEKLMTGTSELPPPKPRRGDSTVQRTAEMEVESTTGEDDGDLLQEIRETIEKSVAPSKVSSLNSALEKLLEEASETPPPKPKRAIGTVQRTAEMETKDTTSEHGGELPQECRETIVRSAFSKAEYGVSDVNLQKLPKEVSETPGSELDSKDKKMQGKTQTSQSVHAPHQHEKAHPQEVEETIEKTSFSNIAKFSEFSRSLEKLFQEAPEISCPISKELHKPTRVKVAGQGGAPEQNIKTSVNDLVVTEIEAPDLPKRNGAISEMEERNMAPVDLPPLEGESSAIAIEPCKINEKERRDESPSSDASENNSEFKALLKFSRESTPLTYGSNSPQPEGPQFCQMPQREDNNEEEGDGSNLESKFSDENSDSHSGTGNSTRSEEELNPVLMALKRSADRKMPSKSLEDIPSAISNKGKKNNPKEELALSAEDGPKPDQHQERNENAAGISTVPSQPEKRFSNPEKLKGLSKSVPSFLQDESDDRETDTASESSYSLGRIKKSPSSLTNLSSSSGMASLSSVSSSLMSIYSADFGNVDVKGNIQFAVDYVEQLNELHVFICQCKGLAVADVKRQRSDPYVKTYLLPEKYKLGKRKTSVKKKTFNPVYNEILRYKIEKSLLQNQSLNISVWHNDTFGRNSFLGEVELDLGTWDWNDKSNKQINWFPLKPRTSTVALELESRGEMKLALQYVPHPVGGKKTQSTGEVHIWVKECHDLPLLRGNRLNSFIKCTILPDTSRKSRQKTRTVAKTTNPVFNHTMVYDGFRPEDLKEACVELTVWDHNKLANHFLGGLRIGLGTGKSYGTTVEWMDSTSDETALWEKMINSPNTWIEDTLPLRMLMVAKLTK